MDADYALVVSPVSLAPSTPQVSGGSQGDVGRRIDFTFTSTDPKNSQVYYWIEWGDGSHEEWFGPCESGVDATVSHSWDTVGNFTILAKAKNSDGAESEWSAPTVISIVAPQLELGPIQGGLFKVKTFVINKGAIEITQIHWNITLTGGAFKGKASNGVLSTIPGDGQQKISSDFIIGFGKTTITVTASYTNSTASKSQNATIFLFFIKV